MAVPSSSLPGGRLFGYLPALLLHSLVEPEQAGRSTAKQQAAAMSR